MSTSTATPSTGSLKENDSSSKINPNAIGIDDWEEVVDGPTGRVYFYSEKLNISRWGLPLDVLLKDDEERKVIGGWCLLVDPSSHQKFFANEEKAKAQWQYPDGFNKSMKSIPYLQEKKSYAFLHLTSHNKPRPASARIPEAPSMRRMTLRMLIQHLTLQKVIGDRDAFQAFQIFAANFHAEENVLFFCVAEAFSKRGSKAVGILGLDDLAKSNHKGLPRTHSHLQQITQDQSKADQNGTTIDKIQMVREATAIYNRFLAPGAPDWVCVDQKIVEEISAILSVASHDPNSPLNRNIFEKAKHYVYQNLEQDLLPRFVKAALTRDDTSAPFDEEEDVEASTHGVHNLKTTTGFYPDEVLRHHLLQLQKKPDDTPSLMSTANAYRSLFPSPRHAIEGREGSGLFPTALTGMDDASANEDVVLAKAPAGNEYTRTSVVVTGIRKPFSFGSRVESSSNKPPLASSKKSTLAKKSPKPTEPAEKIDLDNISFDVPIDH